MLILFSDKGVCINGFAHESKMNGWRRIENKKSFIQELFGTKEETTLVQEISEGVLEGLPKEFHGFIFGEPVKSIGTTFCIWQTKTNHEWKIGNPKLPDDNYKDGSADLLQLLDGKPTTYKKWAEDYYELEISEEPIIRIFNGEMVTKELIQKLTLDLEDVGKLKSDLEEIGYPFEI